MKDGIVLHPEYGVNPSIEICIVCGEEMGIALLGKTELGLIVCCSTNLMTQM